MSCFYLPRLDMSTNKIIVDSLLKVKRILIGLNKTHRNSALTETFYRNYFDLNFKNCFVFHKMPMTGHSCVHRINNSSIKQIWNQLPRTREQRGLTINLTVKVLKQGICLSSAIVIHSGKIMQLFK